MANPITWIKMRALSSALNSIDTKELVDVVEKFGDKEFGEGNCVDYLAKLKIKIDGISIELLNRIRRKNAKYISKSV